MARKIQVGGVDIFTEVTAAASGVKINNLASHGASEAKYYIQAASNDNKFVVGDAGHIVYDASITNGNTDSFYVAFVTGGVCRVSFNATAASDITLRRWRWGSWTNLNSWTGTGVNTHDATVRGGDHLNLYRTGGGLINHSYSRIIVDSDCEPMFYDLSY